jgi:hypothetical protein
MIKGFFNLPWFLWAGLAMIFAIVWVYVGPHTKISAAPGMQYFFIRWGHVLTWVFLSINFLLRGIDPSLNGAANLVAAAGGVMYLLFMVMTFVRK